MEPWKILLRFIAFSTGAILFLPPYIALRRYGTMTTVNSIKIHEHNL